MTEPGHGDDRSPDLPPGPDGGTDGPDGPDGTDGPDTADGWRLLPLILGGVLVAFGVSGLLDDSGLAPHAVWVVPVLAVVVAAGLVAARTLTRLDADRHRSGV
ncbi:MAG: hypothetical protein ACK5PP_07810 [Acidimicrobiales bacterium]